MQLIFSKPLPEFEKGIQILSQKIGFSFAAEGEGIEVLVCQEGKGISVSANDGKAVIHYEYPNQFFRGLGILVQKLNQGVVNFSISEVPKFEKLGAMFDMSRHAALNVQTIQDNICVMALMGYSELFLYMEDNYEVEGYPYFGYMRGRYTYDELKACDEYAEQFGMEIIPCIQTLGHLLQAFKKGVEGEIKEAEDLIKVGEEKSYIFLEKLIQSASRPFRSKRIHLGMDEAFALGRKTEGVKTGEDRLKILVSHVKHVCEISGKYGLQPIIWSDMLFRLSSKTFDYYDVNSKLQKEILTALPSELQVMYEDSKNETEEAYTDFINRHKEITGNLVLAPAVSTGEEFSFDHDHLLASAQSAVLAGSKAGIRELVAVSWGDGGAALSNVLAMYGLSYYAEYTYRQEEARQAAEEYFTFCTGCHAEILKQIAKLDRPAEKQPEDNLINPTKFILRQDILLGMYDYDIQHVDWKKHYMEIKDQLTALVGQAGSYGKLTQFYIMLCDALYLKATIGNRLKSMYDEGDKHGLAEILTCDVPKMQQLFIDTALCFSDVWRLYNKPFALELMDMRFGSVTARLSTLRDRLTAYLKGEINRIEELEERRLPFNRIDEAITCRNDITYGTPKTKVSSACTVGRY